ncbi:adenylyl-sulfate kinase [Azospirillum sp. SYSU D00513]|uniref:adenylyl-sulfate kinase n=1 Tax=Azospirillum sp. SYSU D00513 TaxID=2812561 RepID=UPI001A96DBAA|nr:adenylyl-sulfate kinase [Azospirillum sp. SYSU D00513]
MEQSSTPTRPQLRLVIVGHVDHGKSTLIGRLLHDTGSLPEGKLEEIRAVSERRGMPLEWSFVLDSFQSERDQAITIDTTQIWFRTKTREVVIIDAPGHREFLKNMISGAALADAAVLVVDAVEGLREQTRRHAYLLHLLGLSRVAVAVNKMDMADFARDRYEEVAKEVRDYLAGIGVEPVAVIPLSARHGDNMAERSDRMPWYQGPTLLETLDAFERAPSPVDRPLRLPIQDVYRHDERRILVGRIETGTLSVGDTLVFSPSNRSARVTSLEAWEAPVPTIAIAGQSVGFTLDEPIFVERGDIASHATSAPMLSTVFRANLFWLGQRPLEVGATYKLKLATREARVTVQSIERITDTQTLGTAGKTAVERNDVAEVVLRSREMLALDEHRGNPATGRCVLVEGYDIVGGGIISMEGYPDQRRLLTARSENLTQVEHILSADTRAWRNGHKGAILWLTGLSGAGKSTLAMQLEQRLFARGAQVYVLDGDNVRRGLNADLGFAPEDRAENIRRVGEVAALFADAGMIVISAFISPYAADRARARAAAPGSFHEIHVKADLSTCEARDPKGLYKKARAGEIAEFTGISSPYEPPESPELVVDTAAEDVEACLARIIAYLEQRVLLGTAPDVQI